MTQTLPQNVGIDISKSHLDAYAHPAGCAQRFDNSPSGFKALEKWLDPWPVERIAFEATGIYHRAFEQALRTRPLVKLNPQRVRRFAQAVGKLAKTDRIDAAMLAHMAATLQPETRPATSSHLVQLAEIVTARDALIRDRTALKNRSKNLTLPLLKRQARLRLDQVERQIEALEAEIQIRIDTDPELARKRDIIASIKGLGPSTAAQLVITMPELGSLENKQAASLAGLAPITRQSGQWKGKSFIRGGRANVRRALYMPALVAARFNPDLKAKYQQLTSSGKPAKLAIAAIMRKLIVTANALVKANRKWKPINA